MTTMQLIFAGFGLLVGAIAVAIAVAGWHYRQRLAERRRGDAQDKIKEAMRRTCVKCGTMSFPIPGSGNQYRCPNCKTIFSAFRHNLVSEAKPTAKSKPAR